MIGVDAMIKLTPEQEAYIQSELTRRTAGLGFTHRMILSSDKNFVWFKIACILYVVIRVAEIHFWHI